MSTVSRTATGASHAAAVRDAAAQYIRAGVRVLPIRPNSKRPLQDGWPQLATLDSSALPVLWPDQQNYSIGLAMGRWANTAEFTTWLVCIDLDCKPECDGVKAWQQLVAEHGGDEGKPWVQHTPSGGVHLVYCVEHQHTNAKGQLPAGIDVRGEGGQIVAWPSNGQQRRWQQGRAPWDHAPGFAPEWLLDLLQPATPPLPPVEKTARLVAADDPGEIYNRTTDWATLLTHYGWRYLSSHSRDGRTVQHWERPGQTERDKCGGTLCETSGRWGVFCCWSTSVTQMQLPAHQMRGGQGHSFSGPFAVYAAMEHGGDFSAAARHLAREQRQRDTDALSDMAGTPGGDTGTQSAAKEKPQDTDPPGYSVRFTNLADYAGDTQDRHPELLLAEHGKGLLYAGNENMIWGASGCGKSWLAAFAVLQEIRKGNRVLIIDYEMSQRDWVIRLRQLGATQTELRLVEYISPQEALREARYVNGALTECPTVAAEILRDELRYAAERGPITLAVIDGVTEMLSSNMLGSTEGEDIVKMWNALPRIITRETGAGVLAVDHINRNSVAAKQQDALPLGSQHKLSRLTGSGFCVWASSPLAAIDSGNSVGLLHLFCKKDRHGGIGLGANRATLELTPLPGRKVAARLLPYDAQRADTGASAKEQTLAVLYGLVSELHQAKSEGRIDRNAPMSQTFLAEQMTRKGFEMGKDQCKKLLVELAEKKLVRNAGSGLRGAAGDWVPVTSNLFTED